MRMKFTVLSMTVVMICRVSAHVFIPTRRELVMQSMKFPNHQVKAIGKIQSLNSFMKPVAPKMSKVVKKTDTVSDEDLTPLPRIEIFARKYSAGLWLPLKQKSINCQSCKRDEYDKTNGQFKEQKDNAMINEMFQKFNSSSGIEEEDLRNEIDAWIASRLFAEGGLGGERNFIAHVKNLLPQFKKLKPREFEFGYKYIAATTTENSTDTAFMSSPLSSSSNVVYSLTSKERERIAAKSSSSVIDECQSERDIINPYNHAKLDDLYNLIVNSTAAAAANIDTLMVLNYFNESHLDIIKSAQSVIHRMFHAPNFYDEVAHFDIYFDGSAHFPSSSISSSSRMNNSSSSSYNQTAESRTSSVCIKAGAGVFILPYDSFRQPLSSFQLPVCVHTAAGVVSTPFDAELLAGVVAVTIARNLLEQYTTRSKPPPSVTLYTDSKTMCRVFRTVTNANLNVNKTQSEVDDIVFSTALLSTRGRLSRQLMGKLLSHHVTFIREKIKLKLLAQPLPFPSSVSSSPVITTTTSANGTPPPLSPPLLTKNTDLVRWVAGHPERMKTRREWNRFDTGIWVADEIAKGSESLINLGFMKGSNSRNFKHDIVGDEVNDINESKKIVNDKEEVEEEEDEKIYDDDANENESDQAIGGSNANTSSSPDEFVLDMFAQDFLSYSIISAAASLSAIINTS